MERSLCVRDEILLEASIEATDEVALILKDIMEEAGRTLLKIVPVEAQVVIVGSWAEKFFKKPIRLKIGLPALSPLFCG
jgi:DNA polymerase I-like protein with 3'-5' exonuclease and polymerase domains